MRWLPFRPHFLPTVGLVGALAIPGAGCLLFSSEPDAVECRVDTDCDAGALCTHGTCSPCVPTSWYRDGDDDGLGAENATAVSSCGPPEASGWAETNDDCNDADQDVGAREGAAPLCGFPWSCDHSIGSCDALIDARSRIAVPAEEGHDFNLGQGIEAGDLDGDGSLDLVLKSFSRAVEPDLDPPDSERRVSIYFGPFPQDAGERTAADVTFNGPAGSVIGSPSVVLDLDGDGLDELFIGSREPMATLPDGGEVRGYLIFGRDADSWKRLATAFPSDSLLGQEGVVPVVARTLLRVVRAGDLDPDDLSSSRGLGLVAQGTLHLFDQLLRDHGPIDLTVASVPGVSVTVLLVADEEYRVIGDGRLDLTGDGVVDLAILRGATPAPDEGADLLVLHGPFPRGARTVLDPKADLRLQLAGEDVGRSMVVRPLADGAAEIWVGDSHWPDANPPAARFGRVLVLRVAPEGRLEEWARIEPERNSTLFGFALAGPSPSALSLSASVPDEVMVLGLGHDNPEQTMEGCLIRGAVPPGTNALSSLTPVLLRNVQEHGAIVGDLDGDGHRDYALSNYGTDVVWLLYGADGRF